MRHPTRGCATSPIGKASQAALTRHPIGRADAPDPEVSAMHSDAAKNGAAWRPRRAAPFEAAPPHGATPAASDWRPLQAGPFASPRATPAAPDWRPLRAASCTSENKEASFAPASTSTASRATKRQTLARVAQAPRPNSVSRRAPETPRAAGPSADDQIALRHEAARRLRLAPNLDTETARRAAKREGRVQTRQMEMDRAAERAALELLAIYPQYALRELLEEDLHALSVDEVVSFFTEFMADRGGGRWLHECVAIWRDLILHMDGRGRVHGERAHVLDVNAFLKTRSERARPGASTSQEELPATSDAPLARTRDGSSAAPGALAKLRTLRWKYKFDISVDKERIAIPRTTGLPKLRDTAPSPTLYIMRLLQRTAADLSKPVAVRNVCWGACLLCYAVIRGEQAADVVFTAIWHYKRYRILVGRTKRKARRKGQIVAEPFIAPLCGVLGCDLWWERGCETLCHLPTPGRFVFCDFEAPHGHSCDPYAATSMRNNAMPSFRVDRALQRILMVEGNMQPADAAKFTRHSLKHFMGNLVGTVEPPDIAGEAQLEMGRWQDSTLATCPSLAPTVRNAHAFLKDVTRTPKIYAANSEMERLADISIRQLDRARRAIRKDGAALPMFGGWDLLRP